MRQRREKMLRAIRREYHEQVFRANRMPSPALEVEESAGELLARGDEGILRRLGNCELTLSQLEFYPGPSPLWPWVLLRQKAISPRFLPYAESLALKLANQSDSHDRLPLLADCLNYLLLCSNEIPVLTPLSLLNTLLDCPAQVSEKAAILIY
jgi:hypothetical protein